MKVWEIGNSSHIVALIWKTQEWFLYGQCLHFGRNIKKLLEQLMYDVNLESYVNKQILPTIYAYS